MKKIHEEEISMKKWLLGLMIPALMGTVPFTTHAATSQPGPSVKYYQGVITIRQQQPQQNPVQLSNRYETGRKNDPGHYTLAFNHRRRERDRHEDRQRMKERDDARYVINRTATVIFRAQRSARTGHYYRGFARIIAHQNKARDLFRAGLYQEAIFHSLRARRLAMEVIRGNRDNWSGYTRDDREDSYRRTAPRDNDLDLRIDWNKVGKDDAVVNIQFHLNVD